MYLTPKQLAERELLEKKRAEEAEAARKKRLAK